MFQRRENYVLKVASIKGKNMLHILFPLKVAPMRIDNNFKDIKLRNCQYKTTPICQPLKNHQIMMP